MMLRPRDSHELRLLSATLATSLPASYAWSYDVFGNEVCTASFSGRAEELLIESRLVVERFPSPIHSSLMADTVLSSVPVAYTGDEILDLGACMREPGEECPEDMKGWIDAMPARYPHGALAVLSGLCHEIQNDFSYQTRFEPFTQDPVTTFRSHSGACRDFAALFVACARRLGFGARFVSGYIFDPPQILDESVIRGGGATHAWASVYLPGAGWIEFDPTNGLVASDRLIRVAAVRMPHQAQPIVGSFIGAPSHFIGLWVGVDVREFEEPESGIPAFEGALHSVL